MMDLFWKENNSVKRRDFYFLTRKEKWSYGFSSWELKNGVIQKKWKEKIDFNLIILFIFLLKKKVLMIWIST